MRSLTSLHESRVYSPENFWSPLQKDFCNNIGTKRTYQHVCSLSAFGGKVDMRQRLPWSILRLLRRQLVRYFRPLAFDQGSHFIRDMVDVLNTENVLMRRRRSAGIMTLPSTIRGL
jgi:hypothetical protein